MGTNRYHYNGYKTRWLLKTDLKPKTLKIYGVIATQKQINEITNQALDRHIITGGYGRYKKINTYSINRIKELCQKKNT